MLKKTGERQVGTNIHDIRDDHKERYLWAAASLEPSFNILDAGCGIGYGSNLLANVCQSVIAYDISEDAIKYANRFWKNEKITFKVADIQFLQYATTLDAIVAFEVVEHLVKPELFLDNANKLLKLNGKLFISVPNERKIHHSVYLNPFHIKHFTLEEITQLLNEYGFEVKQIMYQNDKEIFNESGNFIIIESMLVNKMYTNDESLNSLLKSAVTEANKIIVDRAELLHKSKKDIEHLKNELKKKLNTNLNKDDSYIAILKNNLDEKQFLIQSLNIDIKFQKMELDRYKEKYDQLTKEFSESEVAKRDLESLLSEQVAVTEEIQEKYNQLAQEFSESEVLKKNIQKEQELEKNKVKKLLVEVNNILAVNQALSSDNQVLKQTNEKLGKLLQETSEKNHGSSLIKEKPSIKYLMKKLKYHRFYIPFLYKSLRNSFGFKKYRR